MIPIFRDAAAAALGERWASATPGWYDPGGDKPSFLADDDDDSGGNDVGNTSVRGRSQISATSTRPATLGRGAGADGGGGIDMGGGPANIAMSLPTTPPPSARVVVAGKGGRMSGEEGSFAPFSEPSHTGTTENIRGGGDEVGADGKRRRGSSQSKRPYTTERSNAEDLAQYLGVGGRADNEGGDNGGPAEGKGQASRRRKKGVDGLLLEPLDEEVEMTEGGRGWEGQVRAIIDALT